jgi:hypothetical protein
MGGRAPLGIGIVRAMHRARKFIWVLLFWVALPLALAEAILRVSFAVRQEIPPTLDASLEKEWRWAEQHLAAGRATLSDAFAHDPQLGWRVAGVQAPRGESGERAPRRMLFVGDSYTYGQGVDPRETFARRLGERLRPDWEVLNLAAPGYGTDQQVLSFEGVAASFAPDVVILGFYVRDYPRNLVTFRDYAKPMFVPDGEGLRLVNAPVIAPEALFEAYASGERRIGGEPRWYLGIEISRKLRERWIERISEDALGWRVLSRIMARFARNVRASGAEPVWLVIPNRDVVTRDRSDWERLEILCEERCAELEMPCLRLADAFVAHSRANSENPVYRDRAVGGHLSATGHAVVEREIASFLSRSGLLGGRGDLE